MGAYLTKLDALAPAARWQQARTWLLGSEPHPFLTELRGERPVLVLPELTLATTYADCSLILRRHLSFQVDLYKPKQGSYWMAQDETPGSRPREGGDARAARPQRPARDARLHREHRRRPAGARRRQGRRLARRRARRRDQPRAGVVRLRRQRPAVAVRMVVLEPAGRLPQPALRPPPRCGRTSSTSVRAPGS